MGWTADDLKKKGLVQDAAGNYVPVSSLVAKGKVDKIQLPRDFMGGIIERILCTDDSIKDIANSLNTDNVTADKIFKAFNETGFMFAGPIPQASYYGLPTGELLEIVHTFDINPCPAPRMTKSDQWKLDPNHEDPAKRQRKPVQRYFTWKNAFVLMAKEKGFTLGETLRVLFILPMPKYLSRNKREMRRGQAHKQRPDTDNMLKGVKDAFCADDGYVWDERGVKVWGDVGQIIIFKDGLK